MRRLIIIVVTLLAGIVFLSALPDIEIKINDLLGEVFEYPSHELHELLFAENRANSEEQDQDLAVKKHIILAQNQTDIDMDELNRKIEEAMKRVDEATRDIDAKKVVTIEIERPLTDTPYLGVVTEDMTLSQAADFGYNKFYGVLITRVVPDSPARVQRILPDDIIMEIDGQRVLNRRIFTNLVNSYNIGDTVTMKIFRNRQEMDINFTFGSRQEGAQAIGEPTVTKKKISVGEFGGSWIPIWFIPDMDDVNHLISSFGFTEIDDKGQFLNGGGAKINVGKGLFLGGMGAGYSFDRRTYIPDDDVIRRMRYSVGFGGITLEQRIPIARKLVTSVGSMLGWGNTTLEFSQNDGNYSWDEIASQFNSPSNNYLNVSKSYIFLQPKAEIYYRFNSWLGIRSEVGYILSYSYHSGWNIKDLDDVYEIKNSPDTSFDGLTISVGPWFGF